MNKLFFSLSVFACINTVFASLPSNLQGAWSLSGITCGGQASSKTVSQYLYQGFTGGMRSTFLSGCMQVVSMGSMNASGGNLTLTDGTAGCYGSCSGISSCGVGGGSRIFPYALSSGDTVLDVTIACNDTSSCSSYSPYENPCGAGQDNTDIVFRYTKN